MARKQCVTERLRSGHLRLIIFQKRESRQIKTRRARSEYANMAGTRALMKNNSGGTHCSLPLPGDKTRPTRPSGDGTGAKNRGMSLPPSAALESGGGYENAFYSAKDAIRRVYSFVDCSVLILGISLNALLLYLIRTKTASSMRIYSKLLSLSCAMDLIVSCWNFILQPLMLFFLVTTMCQYVYRFCILCKGGVSVRIFWATILACFFLNVGHACILAWADFPREGDTAKMDELALQVASESGLTDVSFVAFGNALGFRWKVHLAIMSVMFPGFYVVIFICLAKIRKAINEMNTLKLQEYNRQVSAAMLFQAILPTLEIGAWCIQIFVPVFMTEQSTVLAIVFSDVPIHLVPVINPLGTIMLVAPYRRAFLGYLGIHQAGTVITRSATKILNARPRANQLTPAPQSLPIPMASICEQNAQR